MTVTRKDVGDGWWEGVNTRGQSGLFPEGYVEQVGAGNNDQSPQYDAGDADWDDDWDDDDSQASTTGDAYNPPISGVEPIPHHQLSTQIPRQQQQQAPVKKSVFSSLTKSGAEDFILGLKNKTVPSDCQVSVVEISPGVYRWCPNEHPYNCLLASPKKESKLKGLKSFIAYQLTPSFNSIQVSRRYKHFDWLYARLLEKFVSIPIPPLPDKHISGRFEEDFIRHRLAQLQLWVDRICRHPILAQSDVWMHFMTCTDEKRWKQGKRKAEKDEFVGPNFFYAVQAPPGTLDMHSTEKKVDHFGRFTVKMDDAVKHLFTTAQDQTKKYSGPYKREFVRISAAFSQLADAFNGSGCPAQDLPLNEAIRHTAKIYDTIGTYYEEQPRHDYEPMSDVLHEYKGLLAHWPDIISLTKGAVGKKREHQKLQDEGRVDPSTAQSVYRRADVVTYATLAEMDYFQSQRISEFKDMIQDFLREQIVFYEKITAALRQNLEKYERL